MQNKVSKENKDKWKNHGTQIRNSKNKKENNSGNKPFTEEISNETNEKKIKMHTETQRYYDVLKEEPIHEEQEEGSENLGDSNKKNGEIQREKWASKTEFILSGLGYCIGIGNVWRFPYLCYRSGGGAFLVPYLIMLVFCGIPLFFLETSLGQFASTGCLTLFRICPLFKGAGIAIVVVNFIVTMYFVTLYSYPLLFLRYSFSSIVPWSECNNTWNTDACVKLGSESTANISKIFSNMTSESLSLKTSADEFFNFEILRISPQIDEMGGIVWPLFICNFIAWAVTYLCISNGVKTVGKVVYFTATFPFVILFILLVRGLTLPGAWNGVHFYIYPQWDQITNFKIWADAAVQIFFSLGPGWGGIVNMASYNDFSNNNKWDSIIIPICNCGTSIFAGFVVFSVLGYMSNQTGLPISTVATGGPGLAFITYPEAISMLPLSNLWAILFFLMLFFLGLDSAFVGIEAIVTSITDKYTYLRNFKKSVIFGSCVLMWILSIVFTTNSGIYWLTLIDYYAASISVVLVCLVEVIIVGWIYGVKNFVSDIEFMIKEKVSWIWIISWKVTTPLILSVIFAILLAYNTKASYNHKVFPDWAIDIGWMSCFASMIWIPIYMGYHLLYVEQGDLVERFKSSLLAEAKWGPAQNEDRIKWIVHNSKRHYYRKKVNHEVDQSHQEFIQLSTS